GGGPRRGRGRGGVRRLLLHPAARHLLFHHHARLLADLLRRHLHVDGGHRRRERADVPAAAVRRARPVLGGVHAQRPALVRARDGHAVVPVVTALHPVAVRHGPAVHSRERTAYAHDRLSRSTSP